MSENGAIDLKKVPLQEGESSRIIISRFGDGRVNTTSSGIKDIAEVIGILEMSKDEILKSVRKDDPYELVEVILDQLDVEMDVEGNLEKEGIEIGKPIKVARMTARMREQRREEFLNAKNK